MMEFSSVSSNTEDEDVYFDFSIDLIFDPAYYIDDFLFICDIISVTIGIPLNLVLIGAILLVKRLHLQRNFIWLGIGTSNIIMLISHLMVDLTVHLESSASARALSIWFAILSTGTQTANILFALLERYLCINHPKWHKSLCTTTSIIVVQMSTFILLFLALGLTNIPIFKELFVNQFFSPWGSKFVGSFFVGFFSLFCIGQIVMRPKPLKGNAVINSIGNQSIICTKKEKKDKIPSHFLTISNNRVSCQNFNAAQNIFFMSKVYLLFQAVILISLVLAIDCVIRVSPSEEAQSKCYSFVQGFYYTCGISTVLYSSIIDPIAFVTLKGDLLSCLKSRWYRISVVAKELEQDEMTQI